MPRLSIADLNALPADAFAAALAPVFENAPWVAGAAAAGRPYGDAGALLAAMVAAIRALPEDRLAGFLAGHPDLAGKAARAGAMTAESDGEQASAGLDRLDEAEYARFHALNDAYRARFGFPFIVCVRNHDKESILAAFETRLRHDRSEERRAAVDEVAEIARHRLAALLG